jgi:hypothetical protein
MTLRLTQLRFAAVALFAAAVAFTASSVAVPSARAFTMENLSTNGGNTTRFADPNDRVKNFDSQGTRPFGQNGPTMQFGAGQPYSRPFTHGYAPPPPLVGGNNQGFRQHVSAAKSGSARSDRSAFATCSPGRAAAARHA